MNAWVEKALEYKDTHALHTVEDGEDVREHYAVDSKVEQSEYPGAAKETHEYTDTFHVGHDYVMIPCICSLDLVEEHGVDCKNEESDVAEDDNNRRDDETEHKMIVNSEPAEIFCSIATFFRRVKAHVIFRRIAVFHNDVRENGAYNNH